MVYLRSLNSSVPDDDSLKVPPPGFPTAKVIDFREITKDPDRFNICLTQKSPTTFAGSGAKTNMSND